MSMNKHKQKLATLALAIVAAALGAAWYGVRAPAAAGAKTVPPTSEAAPVTALLAQTLPDAAGQPQALARWRGKPLLVNFWATWCPPCVQEMPELAALQKEVAAKNIQVIGIGVDSPSNIAEFSKKYAISYPLYVGGMGATGSLQALGNQAGSLPYTVLIGADGVVKKTYLGRLDFARLRADLAKL